MIKHSTFFRAACKGEFLEGKQKQVQLPETDVEIFPIYVQWMYSGEIVLLDTKDIENDTDGAKRNVLGTKLYILADRLGDTLLQNKVIDYLIDLMKSVSRGPTATAVSLAYEELLETATLRKFVLDVHVKLADAKWLKAEERTLPREFIHDLALRWAAFARSNSYMQWNGFGSFQKCQFHVHNDDVPKCS